MHADYGNDSSNQSCLPKGNISSVVLDNFVTAATIVSSSLSIAGSVLIIITFLLWKDVRRSTARFILVWLAVADLFGAAGYLAAGIVDEKSTDSSSKVFCIIQAFVTTYFPVASFFWTAYLALYFVVNLVLRKHTWGFGLLLVFHLSAWFIPLVVLSFAAAYHLLGADNGTGTGGWCWVSDSIINSINESFHSKGVTKYFVIELVTGKLWEILSYFVVALCYVLIFVFNRCQLKKYSPILHQEKIPGNIAVSIEQSANPSESLYKKQKLIEALVRVDLKLLFIPVVFVFLRIWGTIRFFISMIPNCHVYVANTTGICINEECLHVLYNPILVGLQAFCDPFQGFSNCILFIFCSKVIILRLLHPFRCCIIPLLECTRNCRRSVRSEQEERQYLIVNRSKNDKGMSHKSKRVVSKSPHLIRVTYSPKASSHSPINDWTSDRNQTSDYASNEDDATDPSHHISYGSVDRRSSSNT